MKKAAALSLLLTALAASIFLSPLYVRSAWVGSDDKDAAASSSVLKNVQDATYGAYQSASDYAGRTGESIRQAGANVADRLSSMVGGQEQVGCDDDLDQRSLLDRAADAVSWRSKPVEEERKDGTVLGGATPEEVSSWEKARAKMQEARHAATEAASHVKEALFHRSSKSAQKVQQTTGSYAGKASEAGQQVREGAKSTYSAAQDQAGAAKDTLGSTVERVMETLASVKDTAGEKLQDTAQATYSTLQDTAGKARDTVGSTFSSAQEAAARGARTAYDAGASSAGSAYESVGGAYSTASDVGSSAYQAAREKAGAAFDAASEKAGSAYDAMFIAIEMLAGSIKSAPGRTAEYAGSATDRLGSATQSAREASTGTYEDVVEQLPEAGQVKNASSEAAGAARGKAAETAGAARDKAGETAGAAGGYIKEKVGDPRELSDSTRDAVRRQVPEPGHVKKDVSDAAGAAKDRAAETAGAAGEYIRQKVGGSLGQEKHPQGARGCIGDFRKDLIPADGTTDDADEFYARISPKDNENGTGGTSQRQEEPSHRHGKPSQGARGYTGASPKNLIPSDGITDETEEFYAWIRGKKALEERQCDCRCEKEHAPGSARDVAGVLGSKVRDVGQKVKDQTVGSGSEEDGGQQETTPLSGPQGAGYLDSVGPIAAAAGATGMTSKVGDTSQQEKGARTEEVAAKGGGVFTSLGRLLHLASFAFSFGTSVWMTFLSGQVLSKVVSRQQFGQVQSRLFPAYLKSAAVGQGLTFLLHWIRHPWLSSSVSERLQFINLSFSLAANIINTFYLEPQVSRVMFERLRLEKEEGGEDGKTAVNGSYKTRVAELARHFNILHGYSSLVNLLSLVGQTWHLWYLSRRLVI